MMNDYPERIVCLTEETTETLYLLGEQSRIVGISAFTVRPKRARQEKPRVSLFNSASIDEIIGLKPDLVLGFSDIQADIAKELIKAGLEVYVFNHRTVDGILRMIRTVGALVGVEDKAKTLATELEDSLLAIRKQNKMFKKRPKVYFEEWGDPIITGIGWVSELIEIAGGQDCFKELSVCSLAKDRIVTNHNEVIEKNPDIIIGSWCGKKFQIDQVVNRPGWQEILAVKNNQIFEIKSSIILQPGPAALTDGINEMLNIIKGWRDLTDHSSE